MIYSSYRLSRTSGLAGNQHLVQDCHHEPVLPGIHRRLVLVQRRGLLWHNGLEGETDSEGHLLRPTHGELRLLAVDEDSGNEGGILVLDYEGQCGYKEL